MLPPKCGIATPDFKDDTKNNITHILSGTYYARDPAPIDKLLRAVPLKDPALITNYLEEFKRVTRRVRFKISKHEPLMSRLIANMTLAFFHNKQIIHSRNRASANAMEIEFVEFLAKKGLIKLVIGKPNEYQGNSSWFVPTDRFRTVIERADIQVRLEQGDYFLCLRDKDKNSIEIPGHQRHQVKALSASVSIYNRLWLNHFPTLDGYPISPYLRRIFSRYLELGGRFYGGAYSHVNMKKADRLRLKIDGEDTVEPDFKAMHVALLYAMVDLDMFELCDDPYDVPGYSRKTIKAVFLRMINSKEGCLKANITRSGRSDIQALNEKWKGKTPPSRDEKKLLGFIENIPPGTRGEDLLKALQEKHPRIAHLFCSDDIGLKLQRTDSDIMAEILQRLAKQDIPALPVHDSIRCKKSDLASVKEAMADAYREITKGFSPVIDVD